MSTRSTAVALAVRRRSHETRYLYLWVGVWFLDLRFRLITKLEKRAAETLPRT